MKKVILSVQNIHKRFPGVYALNNVHFELLRGEVHALLGENGAGKSTLIKILAGIYKADEGEIFIKGEKSNLGNVDMARSKGISAIHQELCLVPHMTVAENIFLGKEPVYRFTNFVKFNILNSKTQKLLDSLGVNIKATDKVGSLSIARQQMVEIAKAISVDAEIIIMDEPTSSLDQKEVEILFKTILDLKRKEISIIYISHIIEELFKISDRVTVLRDGMYVGTKVTGLTTREELITMMVGRELKDLYIKESFPSEKIIFEVRNLKRKNKLNDISFSLRSGEVLGISGLVGAGRSELARAIFGIDRIDSGQIFIEGKRVIIKTPIDAMNHGVVLVPENRKEQALFLKRSVSYNITLSILNKFIKLIWVNKKLEESIVSKYIKELSIKTTSFDQLVGNLSGGNQQKIVVAKWLATNPKVFILDEPTRGIDVGAKAEIYSIINDMAKHGVGIIMISSELPEIINISDRVLVMHKGSITGMLNRKEFDQKKIITYATGESSNGS